MRLSMQMERDFVDQGLSDAYIPSLQHLPSVGQNHKEPRHCHDYWAGKSPGLCCSLPIDIHKHERQKSPHALVTSDSENGSPTLHEETFATYNDTKLPFQPLQLRLFYLGWPDKKNLHFFTTIFNNWVGLTWSLSHHCDICQHWYPPNFVPQ